MSYQVIARKWRPQTFEEVTGQEAITRTLRNAIEGDRLHHAYLFSGARGVGKTTTARLLAKAVNCHRADGPTPTPCRATDPAACASCREVAEGRSIDVLEIDAASNTGVDNVRDAIINTIGVRPARDRYKVFIIDEVHMLSGAAFNALLKTLEEPPPRVLFIMATTESHKVPDTILSRCQQFEFRTIHSAKIAERLRLIADAEQIKVGDDALREIARAGEGSMRDAQSAFDQVISFSEGEIGVADVEAALGIAGVELRARVMRAVASEAPAEALAVVDDLVMRGHDLRNFCRDLLAHVRDLLVLKVAGEGAAADATEAERAALKEEAASFSESDLVRFFHSLTETEKNLRESAHPRYQLEIGLFKLIEMRRLAPVSQLVERLSALEEALRTGKAPAATAGASPPPTAAPPAGGASRRGGGATGGPGAVGGATPAPTGSAATPSFSAPPVEREAHADGGHASAAAQGKSASQGKPVSQDKATPAATARGQSASPAAAPASSKAAPPADARVEGAPPAARPAPQPAGAPPGLKLVPAPTAPGAGDDAPPFPVSAAETYADYFKAPPPPPLFDESNAQRDVAAARTPAGAARELEGAAAGAQQPAAADANDPLGRIKQLLDARRKPFLAVALEEARRARIESDELSVEFAPEKRHLRDLLAKPENVRLLREVCQEVLGRETGVRIAIKAAGESDDAPPSQEDEARLEQQRLREIAESHPFIQKVLRTFRAEIVEVTRVDGGTEPQ